MRGALHDQSTKRRSVSVTLNADLVARAAAHGICCHRACFATLSGSIAHYRDYLTRTLDWLFWGI